MSQTQKRKPEKLVIELMDRGFSLLAEKKDADALAGLCTRCSLSFDRNKNVLPGVDRLNFFYLAERAQAERLLAKYRAEMPT
jgi:hypothetical protein